MVANNKKLDKETSDKVGFISFIILKFAENRTFITI